MSDAKEQHLASIPQDIMEDILSRLPVKSLLKFRCVCKTWNSLIQKQKFAELHLGKSLTNASHSKVLLSVKPFWSIEYDDLDDFGKKECDVIIKKGTPSGLGCLKSNKDFDLIGHCNGLICLLLEKKNRSIYNSTDSKERSFYIWNPSTEECRKISSKNVINVMDSNPSMFGGKYYEHPLPWFEVFGFGYDPTIDDYKIVRLVSNAPDHILMEIFSIGTGVWRKKEDHIPLGALNSFGNATTDCLFVNGSFHWIMKDAYTNNYVIVSFNLEEEKLGEIIQIQNLHDVHLRVVGGKLVLLTRPSRLGKCEIWVMDEYGVETSWVGKGIMPELPRIREWLDEVSPIPIPICFSKKGGIFVCVRGFHFMMFDPRDKSYRKSDSDQLRNRPHMSMYVESLISPCRVPNGRDEILS